MLRALVVLGLWASLGSAWAQSDGVQTLDMPAPGSLAPVDALAQAEERAVVEQTAIDGWKTAWNDPERVRALGIDLYQRHQATLFALEAAAELELGDEIPSGWITTRQGNDVRVRFVSACADVGPCSVIDVDVGADGLSARSLYPPEALNEDELRVWRARNMLFETQESTCDLPYNAVVLEREEDDALAAYLIAQPADPEAMVIDGHLSLLLDAPGGRVLATRALQQGCAVVQRPAAGTPIAISAPAARLPSPLHVFTSLLTDRVLFIGTATGSWRVNGAQLEQVAPER